MTVTTTLQPTLWRTCRVLANRTRLKMFGCLLEHPGQSVSAVARRLELPLPVASQYLRALEARSLLTARRMGSRVHYRVSAGQEGGAAQPLVPALRLAFRKGNDPIDSIFTLATAFTHPRRIAVFQAIKGATRSCSELRAGTGLSARALRRHLAKLEARGFVVRQGKGFAAACRRDELGRVLAEMAGG
jgi:DNA-binding transcriptional ArsR family regulator